MNNFKEYKGISVVGGNVVAPLVIIDSSDLNVDIDNISGKIAIIRIADPVIVLRLKKARGLIVERGGVTSHGAVLAREFNIPCIVGVDGVYDENINGLIATLQSDQGVLKVWS